MSYPRATVAGDPSSSTFSRPPGIRFEIAQTARQVETAWGMVYEAYRDVGFVTANMFGLHASCEMIGSQTAVIIGRIGDVPVNTITAVGDGPEGLPLDAVYNDELEKLRRQGRRMVEIGMFADRRPDSENSFHALLELMRYSYWFGAAIDTTDYICGIPPHSTRLYQAAFGFKLVGEERSYACVDGNPVQLMRANVEYVREHHARHRATDYFVKNPLSRELFSRRFMFTPHGMAMSRLELYIKHNRSKRRCAAV